MQEQARRVANAMTWLRILLVPVIWVFALLGDGRVVGAGLIAAGVTDFLDGFVARRFGTASPAGARLGPNARTLVLLSAAAFNNDAPAIPRSKRPGAACAPNWRASPIRETPTSKIANSMAQAAGKPGSARRLIVRCAGSYPGVIRPATSTTGTDRTGAPMPRAALTRLIGQR